ncbi:MAG TPA: hypothetical protein VMZ71_12940, partial [Gemmataceae bacterium]|nr:hypothetical protein [Gemmataceae bacterium]
MLEENLCWNQVDDPFGLRYSHSGGNFGGNDAEGDEANSHRVNTRVSNFASNVNAAVVVNSQIGNGMPSVGAMLNDAYFAAWSHLVVEGDSGDNVFVLRTNDFDTDHMDLLVDGELVCTMHKDFVQALTLRRLGGDDTFQIDTLPANTHLTLEGGTGSDAFALDLNGLGGIAGAVTVLGGVGSDAVVNAEVGGDRLTIDDLAGGPGTDFYAVAGSVFDWTGYANVFNFGQLERLELLASHHDNDIALSGATGLSRLTVRGGGGNDDFALDAITGGVLIALHGEGNADTFNVSGVAGGGVDMWGDPDGLPFGWADRLNLGNGNTDAVTAAMSFHARLGADSIVVNDKAAAVNRRVDIDNDSINFDGPGYVTFDGVESITHHGGTR